MNTATLEARAAVKVEVDSACSQGRWDSYVSGHPDASVYHLWSWRQVVEDAFGHETRYLAAEANAEIVGILPLVIFRSLFFGRFVVSLPFVNYGGLVADSPTVAGALLSAAVAETKRAHGTFLELRHRARRFPGLACRTHKVAMLLRLESDTERQWKALDKKVRNQVRKAEKSGLTVQGGGAELLSSFYEVFARNMRDLGTPVYSRRFFDAVLSKFPERTRVFCVSHDGRPIAASVTVASRDTCEVPWASSLREFNRLCPNMLLYWAMLRHAIEAGARDFDFGRSTRGGATFRFKQQWGAEPSTLSWEYRTRQEGALPDFSPSSARYSLATSLWRRLPVAVTSQVGPLIVRNIP